MTTERLLHHTLNQGWVTLDRETTDGEARLLFRVQLDMPFPAAEIFEQLASAMRDSSQSWLWPNKYESTPAPNPDANREGGTFLMTYRVPRFDRPEVPPTPVTYSYTLPQFRPDEFLFEYRSVDHALKGGAVVTVIPLEERKCRLSWVGAYVQDPGQEVVVKSLLRYIPFIYGVFEENVQARALQVADQSS